MLAVLLPVSPPLQAQPTPAEPCSYRRCALGIVPAWNGLLVTKGEAHERLGNLGFFWTGSLDRHFAGSDSALGYATRAVKVRRVAAVFTDAGALALGYAAVRVLTNGALRDEDKVVAAAGAAAFGVSVPLQFAADGLLSRAIWWKNASYADRER
ncbi:hypothetical protein MASR1M101_29600 [Gemmatimonas sp.]